MYSNVNDHDREGVVNRFIETIRSRFNKYLTAYNYKQIYRCFT